MYKQRSLKKNVLLNLIKTLMSLIFPLITFPYASRILFPEGLGKVNFVNSIISYFIIISSLGIETYGIREAAKVRDDKIQLSQFSKEIFTINIISTSVAYFLLFLSIKLVPKFSEYRVLLCVCSATILFTTIGMNWLYSAVEDYFYITVRSIVFQILSLFLLFILVRSKEDYVKYATISVFSSVGSNLMNFIHSKKYINFKTGMRLNLKKHMKPIFTLFAMAVAVKIYTAVDVTMLGFIKNDWEVGIYTAATKINKIVVLLVASIGSVLLPRLSYLNGKNDNQEFIDLVKINFQLMLLISLPCTFGLFVTAKPIINLLSGCEYSAAIVPMKIMTPLIFIMGISNVLGVQLFMPLNKEKWTLIAVLFGAVSNFALNFVLIPKYGAVGASIATIFAESMVSFVELILTRKIIDIKIFFPSFFKYLINSVLMIIPIIIIGFFLKNDILNFLISVFTGVTVYLLCLFVEKDELIARVLRRKK